MSNGTCGLRFALWIGLIMVAPMSGETQPFHFEDFTTDTYKDAANTTVDWNTVDGALKLFPFVPSLSGTYNTSGRAVGAAVSGDLALVADHAEGLRIIDITDLTAPALVGSYNTPGYAWGVAAAGDIVFVADGSAGLQVIDISDPATPVLAGSLATSGFANHVAVAGDLAFLAAVSAGLHVVDIGDPTAPALISTFNTPGNALGVAVDGDLVLVADDTLGLQLIDVTDPAAPVLAGAFDTPGNARGVDVAGDLAFVADGAGASTGGLQVIDISDPSGPTFVGSYDTPGSAYRVAVDGDRAYIADYYGLQIIDITDPANPALAYAYTTPGSARDVAVAGDVALVADDASGLQLLNTSNSLAPTLAGDYSSFSGTGEGVVVAGDLAYVADGNAGLAILSIADPANPLFIGGYFWFSGGLFARDVAVSGNLAILSTAQGIYFLDVTDPTNPSSLFHLFLSSTDVAVAGDHAFVAASALSVIDITDPAAPVLVTSFSTPGTPSAIALAGDLAFLADGAFGLQVIDISDPANPASVGAYDTPGDALGITVAGDLAFVADGASGLQIVDITDPTAPALVGTYDTPDAAVAVAVAGNLAFVSDGTSGLQVVDITDPSSPVSAGGYDTPGYAQDITVSGDLAFVADDGGGLQMLYVFQDLYESGNVAQSLTLNSPGQPVTHSRITTTATPGFSWEVSADSGVHWEALTPGLSWEEMGFPGTDLRWRSIYYYAGTDQNPVVDDLTVEWLHDAPGILSISDVPNDQGGQVRLAWRRSGHDFPGDPSQIVEYTIYRKIDPNLALSTPSLRSPSLLSASAAVLQQARALQSAGWDFIVAVPVRTEDDYAVVVPTLADSTADDPYSTTFMVSAVTATVGVFFDSAPDSGRSVDNLAPGVPQGFSATFVPGGGVSLTWNAAPEEDFLAFRVYRSTDPGFVPGPETLVHETPSTSWQDSPPDPVSANYRITALDTGGNESSPASSGTVTGAGDGGPIPPPFGLRPAWPNPLRSGTRIAFELAEDVSVSLDVFDISGRLVRTLVREELPAGRHEAIWNGTDDKGHAVPAGVYLYRLRAGGYTAARQMVLIR